MFGRYQDMIDRLSERELADRWAFLLFAIGGSVLIWITKALQVSAILVAAGAMILMLAYAALVNLGPKLKLRADQLGDNCYYLGLVFTLASLSYAIFTFDPANTATTIVQGFGVALVSTVLGLVLRVFFSQGQPDLALAEENARIALTETAAAVRAELDGVVIAFQTFATQTQQHLTELRDQVRTDVAEASAAAKSAIDGAATAAGASLAEQIAETTGEVRKLTAPLGKIVKAIEGHADTLNAVTEKTSVQLASLAAIEQASATAAKAFSQVTQSAEEVRRHQVVLGENSEILGKLAVAAAESIEGIREAAQRFDQLVAARLAALDEAPLKANDRLDAALGAALQRWQESIALHAAGQTELLLQLEKARSDELASARRHNEALDVEIARSRERVGKLQTALIEVANELTAQVSATDR